MVSLPTACGGLGPEHLAIPSHSSPQVTRVTRLLGIKASEMQDPLSGPLFDYYHYPGRTANHQGHLTGDQTKVESAMH